MREKGCERMRRKDREMPKEFGYYVIDRADYGVVAFQEEGAAYSVPLSLVRIDDALYFHSAQSGRKVDLARKGGQVSVSVVGEVEVPNYATKEELDAILEDPSQYHKYATLVYTTSFESVHIVGAIQEVTSQEEKKLALKALCEKYTPSKMSYFDAAMEGSLALTAVFKISMEELTAKRKLVVKEGRNLKFAEGWPENYL